LNYREGPFVIRYPRGNGVLEKSKPPFRVLEVGKGQMTRTGTDMAFVTIGPLGNVALKACEILETQGYSVAHYDMRFLKPIDEEILHEVCRQFSIIITVEDATIVGGLGTAVIEFINENGYKVNVKKIGVPDRFITHGSLTELHRECGLDVDGMVSTAKFLLLTNSSESQLKMVR